MFSELKRMWKNHERGRFFVFVFLIFISPALAAINVLVCFSR